LAIPTQNVPATSSATTKMGLRELMSQRFRSPVISILLLPKGFSFFLCCLCGRGVFLFDGSGRALGFAE
jgi:hypothetical protein